MEKEKRSLFDIYGAILREARDGCGKSHLVYRCNLNFNTVKTYFGVLIGSGLLEQNGRTYTTTDKGIEFLERFEAAKTILKVSCR